MTELPFDDWTISKELWETLEKMLRPGMVTLETGSGLSTRLFDESGCHHTALEHDERFAGEGRSFVRVPLVGKPPWYDWQPPRECGGYDLILIDGPPEASGGRMGLLRVVDRLRKPETTFVLDDTHRPAENRLADRLTKRFGLQRIDHTAADGRRFSILTNHRGCFP